MIEIQRAAIQPTAEMLEQFSHQMPGAPFSHVLKTFEMMSRNSDLFFPGLFRNMIVSLSYSCMRMGLFFFMDPNGFTILDAVSLVNSRDSGQGQVDNS